MSQDYFPAQTLAAEIYVDPGVRTMERGIVSAGRDRETRDHNYPNLELVRPTFPRRVYTQAHCDVTVESIQSVWENRENVRGLEMVCEPKHLRFFQARFERLYPRGAILLLLGSAFVLRPRLWDFVRSRLASLLCASLRQCCIMKGK